jgi:ATP-binding cassette, subfamily C (CFTR/MRP), member 2
MAANVQNSNMSMLKLISVYIAIGVFSVFFVLSRSLSAVILGLQTSRSLFSQLLNSLFRAPMSFFDSTLGRVLSRVRILKQDGKWKYDKPNLHFNYIWRFSVDGLTCFIFVMQVSSDLSIVDLDVPFAIMFSISASLNAYSNLAVLAVVTWQVLFVCVPMICLAIRLQVI